MPIADIHVLLVSKQAAPNLLPVLDPEMKPIKVIMLVSTKMQKQADALESVFEQVGVKVTRIPIINEHDFAELENTMMDFASNSGNQSVALNVTGGTKLMALAAQSIAEAACWPVFYVDVDTDEIIWLGRNSQPPRKITEQLRLRHYLMGYGFKLVNKNEFSQPDNRHENLFKTLLLQIGSLEQPLSQLNWLAQQAQDSNKLSVKMDKYQSDSDGLGNLLRNFEEAGVLTVKGTDITFLSEIHRDFAKGGWLEQYVFQNINSLTRELHIRDKAVNLEVIDASGVKNELDVAFIAKNRLFVIECKTARMDKPEAPKANDTLFKLAETANRIGGLGTHKMLASYRILREPEKKLAAALGVKIVCGLELNRLDEKLKEWMR